MEKITENVDVIVVGAGSAGCVLAGRLSEDPDRQVLLIEAGTGRRPKEARIPAAFPKLFRSPMDWADQTEPQPALAGRSLFWPRGRAVGGSSIMNAQMWVRGDPADYDGWRDGGNPGWGWTELLPTFRSLEHHFLGPGALHGGDGPVHVERLRDPRPTTDGFLAAAEQAGHRRVEDIDDPTSRGFAPTPVTQRRGLRWSAADAYLTPASRRPNLTIVPDALVHRVLVEGGRAVGVAYVAGGRTTTVRASEVVLSAGAVGSPSLLLRSGIGPADHLRALGLRVAADLPAVGAHLQDHLMPVVIGRLRRPSSLLGAERLPELARLLLLRQGMLTSNVAEATGFARSDAGDGPPDLQFIFAPVMYIEHGLTPPPAHGVTIGVVLLRPESEGQIRLRSADPLAPPAIDPAYLRATPDLDVLVAGVEMARDLLRRPALSEHLSGEHWPGPEARSTAELAAFVRRRSETVYHPVGSCRMGPDPVDAVVDAELRVHGVDGLRIADASIMPSIVRANPAATVMAIGERAAALIGRGSVRSVA